MASKTIDHMDFYVAVAEYQHEDAPDQTFNCLRVYVSYRKGRGFIVGYHPGWGDGRMWGCLMGIGDQKPLTAGQEVLAKAATKNSVKELQAMYDSLSAGTARKIIALLFDHRKWPILQESLRHMALSSTWATEELLASLTRQLTEKNSNVNDNEPNNSETMAKTMTAQDYVGKTVSIKGSDAKYVIKSVDGDKLMTDFYRAKDAQPMPCPLPWATLEAKLKEGVYCIEDAVQGSKVQGSSSTDEVEEVEEIVVEGPKAAPKAETIDMKPKQEKSGKPKAKSEGRGKTSDVSHQPSALKYETYTNKKGKTCAKIIGFGENDPAYVNAADLHGSATYERDKDGGKTLYLIFGPRYSEAAKEVCDALNAGKALKDCQAIIDKATEERKAQTSPKGKTYTEAEVADLIKRVVAGDKEAMEIVNAMSKAA